MIARGTGLVALVLVCLAAAASIATLPEAVPLGALALGIALLAFGAIRVATAAIERHAPARATASAERPARHDDLVLARFLYFGGMATLGLLTVRPLLAYTLSDWLFLMAAGVTASQVLLSGRARTLVVPLPPLLIAGLALFSVGGIVSSLGAISPISSFAHVIQVVYLTLVWFWLGPILLRTPRAMRRAIGLWVLSAGICGAGAIAQLLYGDVIPGGEVFTHRESGFTFFFNHLGGVTAIAFIPALALATRRGAIGRSRAWQVGLFVVLALLAAGLTLSGSVGSLAALVVGLFAYLAMIKLSGRAVLAILAAGALLLGAASVSTSSGGTSPIARLASTLGPSGAANGTSTVSQRFAGYRSAWTRIEQDPIAGVGLDVAPTALANTGQVHNIFLGTFYEAGVFGMLGVVLIISSALQLGIGALRRGDDDTRSLAKALVAAMIVMVVFGLSEPVIDERFCWVPAAMLVVLGSQLRRHTAPSHAHAHVPTMTRAPRAARREVLS